MNRPQLSAELKAAICRQVLEGKWTVEQAATFSTFTVQSVKRWLQGFAKACEPLSLTLPAQESKPLDPEFRRIFDEALERVPQLRQRSLIQYVRRHYGCKVPRRVAAAYLKERGLVEPAYVHTEKPLRRFEAPTPLDLVQVDIVYVPKLGGGWLYSVNVIDDHSRMLLGATALEEQTGEAVLKAFRAVVQRWGKPARVLTDRGTQFVHRRGRTRFQKFVEDELKVKHILAPAKPSSRRL